MCNANFSLKIVGAHLEALNLNTGSKLNEDDVHSFIEECELVDLLNSITFIFNGLIRRDNPYSTASSQWLMFVSDVLREENIRYCLDNRGGMHPAIDSEFVHQIQSTLAGLGLPRYAAARLVFEKGVDRLTCSGETSDAIRGVFDACETVFKLQFPTGVQRLGTRGNRRLFCPKDFGKSRWRGETGHAAYAPIFFKEWVSAAHFFRHAQGAQEPNPPTFNFAVVMVTTGAAYCSLAYFARQSLVNVDDCNLH